jgi:hypothetical protein
VDRLLPDVFVDHLAHAVHGVLRLQVYRVLLDESLEVGGKQLLKS